MVLISVCVHPEPGPVLLPAVAPAAALGGDTDYHPCSKEEGEALACEVTHGSHVAV